MKIFTVTSKAFLADDNLGDSLDGVEALIRKHEDFDKSFAAQAEKINVSEVLFSRYLNLIIHFDLYFPNQFVICLDLI